MRILLSPRSETLPSGLTSTDGIALSTSLTVPKVDCTSVAILYSFRTIIVSTDSAWAVTVMVSSEGAEAGPEGSAASAAGQATASASSATQQHEWGSDDSDRPPPTRSPEVVKVLASAKSG